MSRVHDALRRAEGGLSPQETAPVPVIVPPAAPETRKDGEPAAPPPFAPEAAPPAQVNGTPLRLNIHPNMLSEVAVTPFSPAPESHLLDLNNTHETPSEEFRTLRTRLNHLQTL